MRTVRTVAASVACSLTVALVALTGAGPAALAGATPAAVSNDPLSSQQWALAKIGGPTAWTRATGRGVLVGVVDSGVDLSHEDLSAQIAGAADCVGSNGDPAACRTTPGSGQDDVGHGTHVSGIIAATRDNGRGVAGVAPDARLLVAKALAPDGQGDASGSTDDINAGIRWVVDHGAKVVNLSLGGNVLITQILGTSLSDGIEYAWAHGAVSVLASGNTQALGFGTANYGSIHAVVVAATGPDDEVAGYSSPTGNARWAVAAPGGDGRDDNGKPTCAGSQAARCVVSTWWVSGQSNTYASAEGTSMAAPHVSGALALLLGAGLSPQQAVDRLLGSADSHVSCGPNSANCHGRLDVAAATDGLTARSAPPATATASPSPASTVAPRTTPSGGQSVPATVTAPPGVTPSAPGVTTAGGSSVSSVNVPPPSVLGDRALAAGGAAPTGAGAARHRSKSAHTVLLLLASICLVGAVAGGGAVIRRNGRGDERRSPQQSPR